MDENCKRAKKELNIARKKYQELLKSKGSNDITNTDNLRMQYFEKRRMYHSVCKKTENAFWRKKNIDLKKSRSISPKDFWKKLSLKQYHKSENFSKDELYQYFKNLANKDMTNTENEITETERENLGKLIDTILNEKINLQETKTMIKKLKKNKAADIDQIIPELLKSLDDNFLEVIVKILNKIFESGKFPKEWAAGIIVVLFKGGDKKELNNYRGITLLSILGKLFVGILNNRLTKFSEGYEVINENQSGFRKGHRTTDHILTLSTLIQHTLNVKNKKLYTCFVDFRKAYDKVSHTLLWKKILEYGINGNFLQIVKFKCIER